MEPCEKLSALLDAFIDGELPEAEMDRVRRHLTECESCRAYVADAFAMREALEDLADVQVPEDFTQNVMDAVRSAPPQVQSKRRAFRPARILAPLAACLAIVAVVQLGPLSSRMTDSAAQEVSQETSETTETAQDAPQDASAGQEETAADAAQGQSMPKTFSAAAAAEECEDGTTSSQVQDRVPEVQAYAPAQTQEETAPSGDATSNSAPASGAAPTQDAPQSDVPSVTTARTEEDDADVPEDAAAAQEDTAEYFAVLTLTADQAGTLLDDVDASEVVRDPDTGAELQRIYQLDRTQFQALTEQLTDIVWEESDTGDYAKVVVELS